MPTPPELDTSGIERVSTTTNTSTLLEVYKLLTQYDGQNQERAKEDREALEKRLEELKEKVIAVKSDTQINNTRLQGLEGWQNGIKGSMSTVVLGVVGSLIVGVGGFLWSQLSFHSDRVRLEAAERDNQEIRKENEELREMFGEILKRLED